MTSVGTRAAGGCVRHRKPAISTCVSCGSPLCSRCIVRTPVGFKCESCTSERLDPGPSGRRGNRLIAGETDGDDASRASRWRLPAVAAGVALAILGLLGLTAYALTRTSSTAIDKTQVPPQVGPIEVPVQFTGAGGLQLAGILSLPSRAFQPAPAVLIVPDFGSVDRDGMLPSGSLPDLLYADMAHAFTARGFASLRYDPRGQGQSPLPPGSAVQWTDLIGDGSAGLQFLAGRHEIDARRLTIAGDGWGGLVSLQVAAQSTQSASVNAVILVSTPGRPVVDTLADQIQASAVTAADGQRQVQQLRSTVAGLVAGGRLPGPAELDPALRPVLPQSQEGFLRVLFSLVPADLARQDHLPTLIVRGGRDPAITAADYSTLATAIGTTAQPLIANSAGHSLAIESSASALNSGMQHLGNPTVTLTRDSISVNFIANWLMPGQPGSSRPAGATPMSPNPNGVGH